MISAPRAEEHAPGRAELTEFPAAVSRSRFKTRVGLYALRNDCEIRAYRSDKTKTWGIFAHMRRDAECESNSAPPKPSQSMPGSGAFAGLPPVIFTRGEFPGIGPIVTSSTWRRIQVVIARITRAGMSYKSGQFKGVSGRGRRFDDVSCLKTAS